jgi:hypothetical protein
MTAAARATWWCSRPRPAGPLTRRACAPGTFSRLSTARPRAACRCTTCQTCCRARQTHRCVCVSACVSVCVYGAGGGGPGGGGPQHWTLDARVQRQACAHTPHSMAPSGCCALSCAAPAQVELVLHPAGAPSKSRSLTLARQRVAINPVSHAACSNVAAAALPAGGVGCLRCVGRAACTGRRAHGLSAAAAKQPRHTHVAPPQTHTHMCPHTHTHPGAPASAKLGYVRLATFNSNTTAAAQEALYDLRKAGVGALVLDIRNNGGGLFPAGVRVRERERVWMVMQARLHVMWRPCVARGRVRQGTASASCPAVRMWRCVLPHTHTYTHTKIHTHTHTHTHACTLARTRRRQRGAHAG